MKQLTEAVGLDDVEQEALQVVRETVGLTEGQNLVNRIVAKLLTMTIAADKQAKKMLGEAIIEEKVFVVKATIQSMLNRGLKARKSVFF